jgi:hypothetical protein
LARLGARLPDAGSTATVADARATSKGELYSILTCG